MRDDQGMGTGTRETGGFARLNRWLARKSQQKLTITTFLVFMGFLAVMSALAAGVGYLTHAMGHR